MFDDKLRHQGFGSIVYKRRVVEENPYRDFTVGEDIDFIERAMSRENTRVYSVLQRSPQTFLYVRHSINTWRWKVGDDMNGSLLDSSGDNPALYYKLVDVDMASRMLRKNEVQFFEYMRNSGAFKTMALNEPRKKTKRCMRSSILLNMLLLKADHNADPRIFSPDLGHIRTQDLGGKRTLFFNDSWDGHDLAPSEDHLVDILFSGGSVDEELNPIVWTSSRPITELSEIIVPAL